METRSIPRKVYDVDTLYMAITNLDTPGFIAYADKKWQFFTPFKVDADEHVVDSSTVPFITLCAKGAGKWMLPPSCSDIYMSLYPEFLSSAYKRKIQKFLPFMLHVKKNFVLRL